jgi:NTP pyrophosphatase (non-canonical NTP hydrolase)
MAFGMFVVIRVMNSFFMICSPKIFGEQIISFFQFPNYNKKYIINLKGIFMSELTFSEYQEKAKETALYPNVGNNPYYPTLGLTGEAGEISNKVKKIMRDKDGAIDDETRDDIKKELGDVLWYVAAVASEFGLNMGEIASKNYEKLKKRQEEGKIKGNGDNR